MKIYKLAELRDGVIYLDGIKHSVIEGKHCIYIPSANLKIIWTYNGKIEALQDWDKGRNATEISLGQFNTDCNGYDEETLLSIANEYTIMYILADNAMAPTIGDFVYIEQFVATAPWGALHCDCKGKYGYQMANAHKATVPGKYNLEAFMDLMDGRVDISEGAIGDLQKADNVINGYLIDVRRTIWDMMQYRNRRILFSEVRTLLSVPMDKDALKAKIMQLAQFPFKQRKSNYQSYLMNGEYIGGSRNTQYRIDKMGFDKVEMAGRTVLDLGCNLGAMCFDMYHRGARKVTGIDVEADYTNCSRELARYNGMPINFLTMDLNDTDAVAKWTKMYYPTGVDVLFVLSLYKHMKEQFWTLLNSINFRTCYVESHNAPKGLETEHVKEMIKIFKSLPVQVEYLGMTEDRSPRCVWKLTA